LLQNSTSLSANWNPVSTNTLNGSSKNFTNDASGAQQFWRALWLP
jgi:hypothetical protein